MPPPYKLVLFDFDGTLIDTVVDIAHHANEVLRSRGCKPASKAQVKEAIGWGVHELFSLLAPSLAADTAGLDEAVESFKSAYRKKPVRETRPFPGVIDALEGPLQKTLKSIVTNKPQDITLQILDELDMRRFFDSVIGVNGGFPPKPDPSAVLHLISQAGIKRGQAVYVGDSRVDAQTSAAAGIDFAWVDYGYQALDGERPCFRFSRASDWSALVS